jgi:UDP-GlcNAc:undecaprenyl-phosphate/decaprenyl-phosphate GlcNAc-1-phosphate transferase
MAMNGFFVMTLAVALSMMLIPFAKRLAPRLGMVDMPDPRKVHTAPVPRVGGWGITIGSLVPLVLVFQSDPLVQSFAAGGLVLFAFGLWDDAKQISHWKKFAGQLLAAGLVVYHGDLYVARLPFFESLVLTPEIGKPFTMFALIGVINAINHSDGLDGLASGESMLSLIAIAFLGYLADNALVIGMALATIGGTLGFLRYNTHPARVFMGDAGSQFLGFTLGVLLVYLTQVAYPATSAALPLLLLGLPIADILAVLYQRIRGGMHWFKATRNHVHHRLLGLGFSHFQTVVIIYSVQAALVVGAVSMRYQSDLVVGATYFAVIAALFTILTVAERRNWKVDPDRFSASMPLPEPVRRLADNKTLRNLPLMTITVVVPMFMLFGALSVEAIPSDFGAVASALAALMLTQMLRKRAAESLIMRAALYVTAAFSAYLLVTYPGAAGPLTQTLADVMVFVLAAALGIFIRFLSERKFSTTPTDFLVAFGLVALVMFNRSGAEANATTQFVTYAIVLFYGCEVISERVASRWHVLNWAALATLTIAGVRGLWSLA